MSNKQSFFEQSKLKKKASEEKLPSQNCSYLDFILSGKRDEEGINFNLSSKNKVMLRIEENIRHTIGSRVPILITGESGSGKTYLAKRIHKAEKEITKGDVVVIGCENTYTNKKETNIFFRDFFSQSNSSLEGVRTIILKEIDLLDQTCQGYVLKFLQDFSRKLPEKSPRLIATSSRDIYSLVEKGLFKQDLYYRLYVLQFRVPALSERMEDFDSILKELLLEIKKENDFDKVRLKFLDKIKDKKNLAVDQNIKSLKDYVHKLFLNKIQPTSKEGYVFSEEKTGSSLWLEGIPQNLSLKEIETYIVLETLKNTLGNRTHAAKSLGISLRTLRNKINEYLQRGYPVTKPQKH